MKKICLILSGIDTALAFEWIIENLDKKRFQLHFILLNTKAGGLENYLSKNEVPFVRIRYSNKKDIPSALLKTIRYLKRNKIDLVHAHLLDAGIVGISAARIAGIKDRLYTRHYSTYHHVYHPKGVYYDKIINKNSSKIIAVSEIVRDTLIKNERINPEKIQVIHHGFPLEKFKVRNQAQIIKLKSKYNLDGYSPVVGIISRYTKWKGIQYIIPAFKKVLLEFPNSKIVLANAKGEYKREIDILLSEIPDSNLVEIEFEEDLISLFQTFDIFIHTPINNHSEAFGQVYIESMAAGIPSVFTISGIGNEILRHNQNSIVVEYCDSDNIYQGIIELLKNNELYHTISTNAQATVGVDFELEKMIGELTKLYD